MYFARKKNDLDGKKMNIAFKQLTLGATQIA
jgi:hypothetical protein